MSTSENDKMVDRYFKDVEDAMNSKIQDNCVFSVQFFNDKNRATTKFILAGKEVLKSCFLISEGIANSLDTHTNIVIKVLSTGETKSNIELSLMFEKAIELVVEPVTKQQKKKAFRNFVLNLF